MDAAYFGSRLKELREAAGFSQKDVCERAGLTPDGLSKLERGLRLPGWETVIALADVLGVSTEEFRQAPVRSADDKPRRGRPRKAPTVPQDATQGAGGERAGQQGQAAAGSNPGGKRAKRKR